MDADELPICPLCRRVIPQGHGSRHHLIPVLKGGQHGPIVLLHNACHSKIHSVLKESELARVYNTVEKLLTHEEIAKFVCWIQKRPPEFHARNRSLRKRTKG